MHFCNDTLPLDNIDVKESIQKEFYESGLIKNKPSILLLFSRAERWFPFITPIIQQYQLPDDIKYIAIIESHLSNVTSPMGAKGFWQLLPHTAQNFGLEVNDFVDERLDVEKSTIAACKYIKQAYLQLQNWPLAAAAYNYGINGTIYQLKKQNVQSFHQLKLNKETKEFLYRIIAYKTILLFPEHFGIKRKFKPYKKILLKTIQIDSANITISSLSQYLQCPKLLLKAFNPWLLTDSLLNPNKKTYTFKYPKNILADYSPYISDLLGYSYNSEKNNPSINNKDTIIIKDSANLRPIDSNKKSISQ